VFSISIFSPCEIYVRFHPAVVNVCLPLRASFARVLSSCLLSTPGAVSRRGTSQSVLDYKRFCVAGSGCGTHNQLVTSARCPGRYVHNNASKPWQTDSTVEIRPFDDRQLDSRSGSAGSRRRAQGYSAGGGLSSKVRSSNSEAHVLRAPGRRGAEHRQWSVDHQAKAVAGRLKRNNDLNIDQAADSVRHVNVDGGIAPEA
jgi:hypothetical protein